MATRAKHLTTVEQELDARDAENSRAAPSDRATLASHGAAARLHHSEGIPAAPLGYQAETLRGQICDDINRRFWRARKRIMVAFEGRKETVQRDFDKLPPDQFLAKYNGWRFL